MITRIGWTVAVVGLLTAAGGLVGSPAAAQEVGLFHLRGSSELPEMGSPQGIGITGRFLPTGWASVRAGAYSKGSSYGRIGRVCTQYDTALQCRMEDVHANLRVRGVEFTGHVRQRLHHAVEVEAGAGLSISQVSVDEETESGRTSDLTARDSGQPGALFVVTGRIQPMRDLPLVLEIGLTQHLFRMNACSDSPWRHDPYCGDVRLRELRIGLGFSPWD